MPNKNKRWGGVPPTKRQSGWVPFEDLPIVNGEDDGSYESAMAKYGHRGCPGIGFDDVCAHPWDCASKGKCKVIHNSNKEVNDAS